MKVILATFGSYGDIRPFLWLGKALRKYGHDVLFIANPFFSGLIEKEGFEFRPAGSEEDYRAAAAPAATTGNRFHDQGERIAASRRLFSNMFLKPTKMTYDIVSEYRQENPVIVGHFYAYGAKLASERFGLPFMNVCLSPYWLKPFTQPSGAAAALGKFGANATMRFIDGQLFTKPFNALRAEIGLSPMSKPSMRWMFEGNNLCLFPGWLMDFSLEQGIRAEFAGFPLERPAGSLPAEAASFLQKHERPVVFTPGSAVSDTAVFFREALKALRTLGKPGIFLSHSTGSIPEGLPENVLRADFLPLESFLGMCSAIVHHGGIGTAAQAMACGTPQLFYHRMEEQRENARVLTRLGTGYTLPFAGIEAGKMAASLDRLINDPKVKEKCSQIACRPLGCPEEYPNEYLLWALR